MTQTEMIDNMYKTFDGSVSKAAIEQAFKQVFSNIKDACASGDTICIRNFGTFYIKDCQKRTYRNLENKRISFKTSQAQKEYL